MRSPSRLLALALLGFGIPCAFAQIKGGEDQTSDYEVVPDWPQPWSQKGYIWGSNAAVFAQTPNRVFLAVRGELKLPDTLPRTFQGFWGSLGERATVPKAEPRNCIIVVDANGKVIEAWTQWDHLFSGQPLGPHSIKISPYDPDKHVWLVDETEHQIFEFTNDGKELVMTLGEKGVPGNDQKHFGRPQDIAWLPNGDILVADGLINSRVVKFDKSGKFLMEWGSKGNAPGQFSGPHGIATDRNRRVYVADRSNHRIQIFDENGKYIDQWGDLLQANTIFITADQQVWVADGTNARLLKFNMDGKLLYWWGTYGPRPGAFWEPHSISVDSEGNLYIADSFLGRTQKFRPKAGADKTKLVGAPMGASGGR
jgi:DNA-binding beta-propeller fold protein YncE